MIIVRWTLIASVVALRCTCAQISFADDVPAGINDSDPAVRLRAWHSIANDAKVVKKNVDQLLPLLPSGLRDSDVKVRGEVVKVSAVVGLTAHQEHKFLLSSNPETVKALLDLLKDDDTGIRKSAAQAIWLGVEPTDELEDALLSQYAKEKSPGPRAELISVLAMTSGPKAIYYEREPSERVVKLILKALDDSAKPMRSAAAESISMMKTPPAEALSKMVEGLDPADSETCHSYVMAIQRYGASAMKYLPKLENIRRALDSTQVAGGNESLKATLDDTIRIIRDAAERNAAAEKKPSK